MLPNASNREVSKFQGRKEVAMKHGSKSSCTPCLGLFVRALQSSSGAGVHLVIDDDRTSAVAT